MVSELVRVLAPIVLLVTATLAPGAHAQTWRRLCQDADSLQMNFTAVRTGPSDNQPRVAFDRSQCSLIVQPCTIPNCENAVPAVIIDIATSSTPFDAMRGSFIERGNIGDNGADDCNPNDEQTHEFWGSAASQGHGGITMFGTPEQVLYGGCEAGMNFEFFSWPFGVTELSQATNRIRFESHQSVDGEIVMLQLGNIIVRHLPPQTDRPTAQPTTPPPTASPIIVELQTNMTTVRATVAAMSRAIVAQDATITAQATTIAAQASTIAALTGRSNTLESRLVAAVDATPDAASRSTSGCGANNPACIPSVESIADNLKISARRGAVTFDSACGEIDPCDLASDIESLKTAMGNLN